MIKLKIFINIKNQGTKRRNQSQVSTFSTIASNLVFIRNFLSLNCRMFLTKTLYQFVKDSFLAPSTSVIKELQHLSRELSLSVNVLSTQLSTIDFYIFTKSITSYNKKSLQKTYLYSQLTKLLIISRNMNYPRKNLIYLKQVYTFQSNQIKFENLKSSLPLKRFTVHFLTTLNPRKPKVR